MANKVTTVFENDTKGAIQSNEDLARSLDGTESKAKLVAQALHDQADGIEADFKNSVAASDALAAALGPEMAAKIGQNGIDKFVADLKGAGLTADDIKADVGDLAGALQHLDSVGKTITGPQKGLMEVGDAAGHAKTELGHVHDNADNSRSVLANMVGNSTQDIAGLGGVAGTAGMALGQMGEYAAEGNIKLGNLAKVAGPMLAVTVAAKLIGDELSALAAVKAFNTKQVDDWVQAIRAGKDATDDLVASAAEVGKIEFHGLTDTTDLAPVLHDLGLKAQEFFDAVKGGQPEIDAFTQKATDAGASSGQLRDIFFASREYAKNWGDAVGNAAVQSDVFGASTEAAANRVTEATKLAEAAAKRYEDQVTTTSDQVQRDVDEMAAKWDELNGTINAEKSMIQYKQQVDDVKQATMDAWTITAEKGPGSPESIAAIQNARLKTLDLESTTADLGATILALPPEQVTNLVAKIDRGELDNLPGIIQGTLDNHSYRIKAHLDSIVADGETHAAGSLSMSVNGRDVALHGPGGGRARGGPTTEGKFYEVTEEGPEMYTEGGRRYLLPGGNGQVTPFTQRSPGEGAFAGEGSGRVQIFVTINAAGHVMTERDITRHFYDAIIDGQARGELPVGIL